MGRLAGSRVNFCQGSDLHKIDIVDFEIDKYNNIICLNQGGFSNGRNLSEGFAMCRQWVRVPIAEQNLSLRGLQDKKAI